MVSTVSSDLIPVGFSLPIKHRDQLRDLAEAGHITVSELLRDIVAMFLEEKDSHQKPR